MRVIAILVRLIDEVAMPTVQTVVHGPQDSAADRTELSGFGIRVGHEGLTFFTSRFAWL
jgi:hypothetical protein